MFREHIFFFSWTHFIDKIGGTLSHGFHQATPHVPGPPTGWRCHASASVCFDASSGNCWPSSEDHPWATGAASPILQTGLQKYLGACVYWCSLEPVADSLGVWKPRSLASRWDRACAIVHATGAHRIRLGLGPDLKLPLPGTHFSCPTSPSSYFSGSSSWVKEELDRCKRMRSCLRFCFLSTRPKTWTFSKMECDIMVRKKPFKWWNLDSNPCLQNWFNIYPWTPAQFTFLILSPNLKIGGNNHYFVTTIL